MSISIYLSSFFENFIHFTSLKLLSKETAKVRFSEMKNKHNEQIEILKKSKELNPSSSEGLDWLIRKTEVARDESFHDLVEFQNQHHILFLYAQMERYFFQCFKYVLMNRPPEIIKEKMISIGTILERNKNFDIIIEEKVESIIVNEFYGDYKKVLKFAEEKLGIIHGYTDDDIVEFNKFKALRNLFAHGDGTVTWVYLEKLKDSTLNQGEKVIITEELKTNLETKINQLLIKFDKIFLESYPDLNFLNHISYKKI